MTGKPFSQACENNKHAILGQLQEVFVTPGTVLEVGAGTGQHAVCFAAALPHLAWQPSDQPGNERLCLPWLDEYAGGNILPPVALNVADEPWPVEGIDGAYSANTAHIMAWPEVERMFAGLGERLPAGAAFCLYGPFNYDGRFTSESNARFDQHLKNQAPHMGIRDMADMKRLAGSTGFVLEADHGLPANNRLLVWRRNG
jgi:hypothetical protein